MVFVGGQRFPRRALAPLLSSAIEDREDRDRVGDVTKVLHHFRGPIRPCRQPKRATVTARRQHRWHHQRPVLPSPLVPPGRLPTWDLAPDTWVMLNRSANRPLPLVLLYPCPCDDGQNKSVVSQDFKVRIRFYTSASCQMAMFVRMCWGESRTHEVAG